MKQPKILVVGSINMDLFVEGANAIPGYGESIRCRHYGYAPGGKGSNQAFAVAKQGADVVFVGCIGDDENGKQVKASLDEAGVNTDYLVIDPETQTGLALMLLDDRTGRYVSYVAMGGNDRLSPDAVRKAMDENEFDMVVMQLEMPLETVYQTYELAREKGIPTLPSRQTVLPVKTTVPPNSVIPYPGVRCEMAAPLLLKNDTYCSASAFEIASPP